GAPSSPARQTRCWARSGRPSRRCGASRRRRRRLRGRGRRGGRSRRRGRRQRGSRRGTAGGGVQGKGRGGNDRTSASARRRLHQARNRWGRTSEALVVLTHLPSHQATTLGEEGGVVIGRHI